MTCNQTPVYPSCDTCLPAGKCTNCSRAPCCCAVRPQEPVRCAPEFVSRSHRLRADTCLAGFAIHVPSCGVHSVRDFSAWIGRKGQCGFVLKYPAFDMEPGNRLVFRFDSKLTELPPGRYTMQVRRGDCDVCGDYELYVPACSAAAAEPIQYASDPEIAAPLEVCEMFEAISKTSYDLCRPLDAGEVVLPLSAADAAVLCASVICCPVELQVTDGVNSETVEFTACQSGAVVVRRGVGGTAARKFPKGSTLRFIWSSTNVQRVCEGCAGEEQP